uniref:Uncharacterized protein n=1 Tax=Helianthus annuus TaxID=4232 RepID=A0A251SAP8_HELAN
MDDDKMTEKTEFEEEIRDGDRFCKRFPVVPRGADRFIASDDDGVARMVEVRFLNLQPHFCSHGYLKIHT